MSESNWPPNKTATVDIVDFGVYGGFNGVTHLIVSAMIPLGHKVFSWEAVERRAGWEESHSRFVEFGDVKGLLSDLHS